jgi:hypothetical protein
MRIGVSVALAASLLVACGGSESPAPDGGGGSGPASCTSSGPPRGVVLAIQGKSPEIRVMTLADGRLVDHGFHFTGVPDPAFVTMREDGAEAVIAYGGFGAPYGIVAVTLSPDGTAASLGSPVELGNDLTPGGVTYVSKDRVVLAASGAKTDFVVTLDRGSKGFAETIRVPAPGRFPLQLFRRPGTSEALLARVEFGVDTATSVYLMSAGANGAYEAKGASASISPPTISIGVHPGGALVYSPATNPSDMVSTTNLKPTGLLHVLAASEAGLGDEPEVKMPELSTLVAVDPRGGLLVFESPVYEIDPKNDQPTVRSYVLSTTPLDADGHVGAALAPTKPFPALLLNDMQLAPSGHLVTAIELFPMQQPEDQSHPVQVRVQSKPGQWDVCQTLQYSGASHLAFAP